MPPNHTRQREATKKEKRMKKMFAVGATAALMLAASSPAFAQVTVAGDDNTGAQFVDASQVQLAVGVQFGDQNVAANDEGVALASNDLSITQNQVNGGFDDEFDGSDDGFFFVD